MPRKNRNFGSAGWAHIILRGINRENLFYDKEDYSRFLSTVQRFQKECPFEMPILCLMSNHVHILMGEENGNFAEIMKKITVSYAIYYNRKYDRVGHVFQDRYRSEAIQDERYLFTVLRYIYNNPQKAGICSAAEYPYTYLHSEGILRDYYASDNDLHFFLQADNNDKCLEYDSSSILSDTDVLQMIEKLCGSSNPQVLQTMDKGPRNQILAQLKAQGISIRTISRLTGINRNIIQRL